MSLTAEQQKELACFPPPLRTLIELELEAGNSIVEVGHSFPAPPAGAYFKLSNKVSTRPRSSGSGLDFYDRNTSIYSGEFTDAKRFYFVLEPPNPAPPEPDMDAIRKGADRWSEPTVERTRLAQRTSDSAGLRDESAKRPPGPQLPQHAILQSSTSTGAIWLLPFRDARPPEEIQFQLERSVMTLMPPGLEDGKLVCRADAKVTGARYSFLLTFKAALPKTNCYTLRVEASWADLAANHHDYYSKTSGSWFELWTRGFQRASPTPPNEGSAELYQKRCETALNAEAHLDSVPAIQQAIISALKRGGSYSTAHKEGGTGIGWRNGRFIRSDYGESEQYQEFAGETEFLEFLHQFYARETSRNVCPDKLSDFATWKLILRLLRTQ